jgi:hypothetical protein
MRNKEEHQNMTYQSISKHLKSPLPSTPVSLGSSDQVESRTPDDITMHALNPQTLQEVTRKIVTYISTSILNLRMHTTCSDGFAWTYHEPPHPPAPP